MERNCKYVIFGIFIFTVFTACSDGDDGSSFQPPELKAATSVEIIDIGNYFDARDIGVSFTKPSDLTLIEEFRVFIVKETSIDSFDSLAALDETHYLSVNSGVRTDLIKADENLVDIDGDPIQEGISYAAFVLALASEKSLGGALSDASAPQTLKLNNLVRTLTSSLNEGTGGMDTDVNGNIYFADFGAATNQANGSNVLKITPEGEVSNFAVGFAGASGNDFDNEGNLYQSNIGGNTVSKITPDGTVTTFATGFQNPVGIVFDGADNFYVCNCGGNTISKVDMQGNVTHFSSSSLFNCPNGIDIDSNGNLYVANFGSATIVKISQSGIASAFATMPGSNNGHLLIRDNFIYVVSRGLHQIHKVSFDGQVSLLAGNGRRGIVDGPLGDASFSLPNDIAFSTDGKFLYVNDVNGSNQDQAVISPSIIRVIELVE